MHDTIDRNELDKQLQLLNKAVESALFKRRDWMDAHMADYARYQIGESLFDLNTGELLGVIVGHYRFWAHRDPRYDTRMNIEYEFKTPSGSFSNTSHLPRLRYGKCGEIKTRTIECG